MHASVGCIKLEFELLLLGWVEDCADEDELDSFSLDVILLLKAEELNLNSLINWVKMLEELLLLSDFSENMKNEFIARTIKRRIIIRTRIFFSIFSLQ